MQIAFYIKTKFMKTFWEKEKERKKMKKKAVSLLMVAASISSMNRASRRCNSKRG